MFLRTVPLPCVLVHLEAVSSAVSCATSDASIVRWKRKQQQSRNKQTAYIDHNKSLEKQTQFEILGYPQTAQKCFAGNFDGGTTAVMYDGCVCASGGYRNKQTKI